MAAETSEPGTAPRGKLTSQERYQQRTERVKRNLPDRELRPAALGALFTELHGEAWEILCLAPFSFHDNLPEPFDPIASFFSSGDKAEKRGEEGYLRYMLLGSGTVSERDAAGGLRHSPGT